MHWILLTVLSSAFTLVSITIAKSWIGNGKWYLFVIALALTTLSGLSYILALRLERIVLLESVWTAVVLLATLALGFFIFHERVSIQEGVGIVLLIVAIVLLAVKFPVS
ncbi:MAG: hypothetical protein WC400_01675 [Patescibacteria group bacterium]|jgi:uncharacterized membrane protein